MYHNSHDQTWERLEVLILFQNKERKQIGQPFKIYLQRKIILLLLPQVFFSDLQNKKCHHPCKINAAICIYKIKSKALNASIPKKLLLSKIQ